MAFCPLLFPKKWHIWSRLQWSTPWKWVMICLSPPVHNWISANAFDMQKSDIKVRIISRTWASCLAEWRRSICVTLLWNSSTPIYRAALPKGKEPWSASEQLVPLSVPSKRECFLPVPTEWMRQMRRQRYYADAPKVVALGVINYSILILSTRLKTIISKPNRVFFLPLQPLIYAFNFLMARNSPSACIIMMLMGRNMVPVPQFIFFFKLN